MSHREALALIIFLFCSFSFEIKESKKAAKGENKRKFLKKKVKENLTMDRLPQS